MDYAIQYEKNVSPRLIDAHSFVWIISHSDFQNWNPSKNKTAEIEQKTEETKKLIESVLTFREYMIKSANRNPAVAKEAKLRANGICQLCGQKLRSQMYTENLTLKRIISYGFHRAEKIAPIIRSHYVLTVIRKCMF